MSTPAILRPSLVVAEIFGPTVQGEGPSIGRRCAFIRLGGCNLTCVWCDTPYTWDASRFDLRKEMQRMEVGDILTKVVDGGPERVVISGGEPLLQQDQEGWEVLLEALDSFLFPIEVETNGTKIPNAASLRYITQFNVSPKLAHSGDPEDKRIVPGALEALRDSGKAEFKFVCKTLDDVDQVAALVDKHQLDPRKVWIMPEGVDAATITVRLEGLADHAISHGFNLTTRLHVLAWGTKRGK